MCHTTTSTPSPRAARGTRHPIGRTCAGRAIAGGRMGGIEGQVRCSYRIEFNCETTGFRHVSILPEVSAKIKSTFSGKHLGNSGRLPPPAPAGRKSKSEGSKRHNVLQWAETLGQKKLGTWSHGATWASAAPFKTKAAGQIRRAERTARRQARARGRDPGQLFVRRFVGLLLEAAA